MAQGCSGCGKVLTPQHADQAYVKKKLSTKKLAEPSRDATNAAYARCPLHVPLKNSGSRWQSKQGRLLDFDCTAQPGTSSWMSSAGSCQTLSLLSESPAQATVTATVQDPADGTFSSCNTVCQQLQI